MGHANFEDDTFHTEDRVWVSGPIKWGDDDTDALIYAMVCQSLEHENTVGREVAPVKVTKGETKWKVEVVRRSGEEPFVKGMAAATALAIFTNTEAEFASYSWTDCVHLNGKPPTEAEGHASH